MAWAQTVASASAASKLFVKPTRNSYSYSDDSFPTLITKTISQPINPTTNKLVEWTSKIKSVGISVNTQRDINVQVIIEEPEHVDTPEPVVAPVGPIIIKAVITHIPIAKPVQQEDVYINADDAVTVTDNDDYIMVPVPIGYKFRFRYINTNDRVVIGEYIIPNKQSGIELGTYNPYNPKHIISSVREQVKASNKNIDDIYMLGIAYKQNKCPETGQILDERNSQLTVTGKCKIGESVFNALNRELGEEVGLELKRKKTLDIYTRHNYKKGGEYNTIVISTKDVGPISFVPPKERQQTEDDYTKRVEVAIYGTLDEFTKLLKSIDYKTRDEINIDGVSLVKFTDMALLSEYYCLF